MPRFFACVLGAVVLTIFANMTCLFSAIAVSQSYLGFTTSQFLSAMRRFVHFQDFIFALIKAATFGAVIPLVSCFFGFRCEAGAEGVGRATTNSVVVGSIAVIGLDFVLSYIFSFLY
jgi:phospholipid/cholesterol/gamma-HCH transport system permease protein